MITHTPHKILSLSSSWAKHAQISPLGYFHLWKGEKRWQSHPVSGSEKAEVGNLAGEPHGCSAVDSRNKREKAAHWWQRDLGSLICEAETSYWVYISKSPLVWTKVLPQPTSCTQIQESKKNNRLCFMRYAFVPCFNSFTCKRG